MAPEQQGLGAGVQLGGLTYQTVVPELAHACAALERAAFPHADDGDLFTPESVFAHCHTFAEGFFVCLDGDRLVGQAAGILVDFDFAAPDHTLTGLTGEHQCANHRPDGAWYYGTDLIVDPAYRRRGIGHAFYELRKELVCRLGRDGIVAASHIPGYADHRHLSPEEYVRRVEDGDLYDPTLSFQLAEGFEASGVLRNYIHDDATGGCAALIVWRVDGA